MYRRKPVEINGDVAEISLPVVKFPPFKLRALLIEKDPVVWLHCLETYVKYMDYLLLENNIEKVDEITYNNICHFVKSYLHEMAEEKAKVLSLGMNSDVTEVLNILKDRILNLLQRCGLLHLQVHGDSLWDLVKVYVDQKSSVVRALLDGSCKPSINTQKASLSRISQVQKGLKHLVESGGFTRVDLRAFEDLLSDTPLKTTPFAKRFLTASWLETLEVLWAKGRGRFSTFAKQLAIITLFSVSAEDISRTTKDMGLATLDTAELYPLLGSLLLSENLRQMKPALVSSLPQFNVNIEEIASPLDESALAAIAELFPHLTKHQLSYLLRQFEGSVEMATNAIFEDPSIIDAIPKQAPSETDHADENQTSEELAIHSSKKSYSSENASYGTVNQEVPDELRNRTLTRAMRLIYQADEDERDDTYDEAEVSRSVGKISIDDENENDSASNSSKTTVSEADRIEGFLWELLKEERSLFDRSTRGSKVRKWMKKETNWSDEQIEGWARMLEKSPQRARILEEKFMFRGNVKTGKTAYVKNRNDNEINNIRNDEEVQKVPKKSSTTPADKKRQHARNERKKSSKANHNRKAAHDKKLSR
ncbi:hypothetical protein HG536_0H03350 [Torulaspora globosa]|uniref:CUE domain-containing protein n=1 Tax=Torulaspora globosa TaxID=48254 RepID=A0A7G3ZN74_9SACH|nr:uncharacterized protein HG536_0H03350 [Torulaspora globosa]QLL34960.1 hypothetical protein HG536_0H03350 [Torulaspora globosa]